MARRALPGKGPGLRDAAKLSLLSPLTPGPRLPFADPASCPWNAVLSRDLLLVSSANLSLFRAPESPGSTARGPPVAVFAALGWAHPGYTLCTKSFIWGQAPGS